MLKALLALCSTLVFATALPCPLPETLDRPDDGVDKLVAKVVTKKRKDNDRTLVISVRNRGKHWAEPVIFELSPVPFKKAKPGDITIKQRVPSPLIGRAGRAVRPGGTETWVVTRPYSKSKKPKWEVRVAAASFFEKAPWKKAPVELGPLRDSKATLKNMTEFPVRVFLQAPQSEFGEFLFAEDLAPNEEREIGGSENRPGLNVALPQDWPQVFGEIHDLKIIDWSVLVEMGVEQSRRVMQEAWDAELRWLEPRPTLKGEVRYHFKGEANHVGKRGARGKTGFEIIGGKEFRIDGNLNSQERSLLLGALGSAYRSLVRPRFDEYVRDQEFRLDHAGKTTRIYLPWPEKGVKGAPSMLRFREVEGGLIRRARSLGIEAFTEEVYSYEPAGDGRSRLVKLEEVGQTFGERTPRSTATFKYAETDGIPWVRSYSQVFYATGEKVHGTTELEISSVSFEPASNRGGPPQGDGAAELRTLWDAVYRYPEQLELRGQFIVETPRAPLEWLARKRTSGRLQFHGWRGGASPYESSEIKIDGAKGGEHTTLRGLLEARTTIWTRLDPAGWPEFNSLFESATIKSTSGGVFEVDHPTIREVSVAKERISKIAYQDGTELEYLWSNEDSVPRCSRILRRLGDTISTLEFQWIELADQGKGFFPDTVQLRDWFHKDWGPETYRFILE